MKLLALVVVLFTGLAYGASFGGRGGSFGRSSAFRSGSTFGRSTPIKTFTAPKSTFTSPKSTITSTTQSTSNMLGYHPITPTPMATPIIQNHYYSNSGMPWFYYYWLFGNHSQPQPSLPLTVTPKCCSHGDKTCTPDLKPCKEEVKW